MLKIAQLKEIAECYHAEQPIDWTKFSPVVRGRFEGVVAKKGRPRFNTKTKRTYTDTATATSERKIVKWAKSEGITPVAYPLKVRIEIIEPVPKNDPDLLMLSLRGVTYGTVGDVDNYGKTVLDALNAVAYKDDKQIADLHLIRRYGRTPGFQLRMERCGLSKHELVTFRKVLTWQT